MAEVKFTIERMKEVHDRIDDIRNQLQTSINSANDILQTISGNVQSDNIKDTLSAFVNATNEKSTSTLNNLQALDEYLVGKIGSYTSIDEAGVESMSEVQSLLDQLNY